MKQLIDCHTHTKFSPDGKNTVMEMCERAAAMGLQAYGISDHCECNRYYGSEYYTMKPKEFDTYHSDTLSQASMDAVCRAKRQMEGRLKILCGTELGQPTFDLKVAENVAADPRLDYVIGSMHQVPGIDDFCFLTYETEDTDRLLEQYFEEVLKMCKWGKFNILAHLTYPLRYIKGICKIPVNISLYEDMIEMCFKSIIEQGIALEVNSSGLRQPYGDLFPGYRLIRRYRELGGAFVSLGSDAHSADFLGFGINAAAEMAKTAGIRYLVYFEERSPHMVTL